MEPPEEYSIISCFSENPKARPEKEAVLRPIPCVQEVEKFLILMEL